MRKTVINLVAASVIFLGAVIVIFERYQEERVIAVEGGLGFIPMTLISLVAIGGLSYLVANFKAMIYQRPFGTFAVVVYGAVVVVVSGLGYLWVDSIQNAAQANLDVFLGNMSYHANTLLAIAGLAMVGVTISLLEPLILLLNKKS